MQIGSLHLFLLCLKLTTLFASDISPPPLTAPNNVIKLIIKSYVQELLDNPQVDPHELRMRLAHMNDYISSHPALHQRYLWVGSTPPTYFNPEHHMPHYNRNNTRMMLRKRGNSAAAKRRDGPFEEICETEEKWESITESHDIDENRVQVVQEKDMQQFVFTYRCRNKNAKCREIPSHMESECAERDGWFYMYYKPLGENKPPRWGYVAAPHHCTCKIKRHQQFPFFAPTVNSNDL